MSRGSTGDPLAVHELKGSRPLLKRQDAITLWLVGIGAAALLIVLAREAFDVFAILVLCFLLFAAERTIGDWLVDAVGPFGAKTIFFLGLVVVFGILLAMGSVRTAVVRVLDEADAQGFHSVALRGLSKLPSTSVAPSGGGVKPARSPDLPVTATEAPAAASGTASVGDQGRPLTRTRLVLRLSSQPDAVVLQAELVADEPGVNLDEGRVEFTIDGKHVATARLADGRAVARITSVLRGSHRARARFLGTDRLAETVSEAAFTK